MSGNVVYGSDGLRNSLYLLSGYADTVGSLTSYVGLQVSDTGVVS